MKPVNARQAAKSVLVVLVIAFCLSIAVVLARMPAGRDEIPYLLSQSHADAVRHKWANLSAKYNWRYAEQTEAHGLVTNYRLFINDYEVDTVAVKAPEVIR